jgi:hypothetical protein
MDNYSDLNVQDGHNTNFVNEYESSIPNDVEKEQYFAKLEEARASYENFQARDAAWEPPPSKYDELNKIRYDVYFVLAVTVLCALFFFNMLLSVYLSMQPKAQKMFILLVWCIFFGVFCVLDYFLFDLVL